MQRENQIVFGEGLHVRAFALSILNLPSNFNLNFPLTFCVTNDLGHNIHRPPVLLDMDPFRGVKVEVLSQGCTLDLYDDPNSDETTINSDPFSRSQYVEGKRSLTTH